MSESKEEKFVKLQIDGVEVHARSTDNILRAALDNDIEIPYYCWHPALSVPASCRLCLVEIDEWNPKSGLYQRNPKLIPSCQYQVRQNLRVWTKTEKVLANRRAVMEFYLLNHPLDCPICDKAGECFLQDYSYRHGNAQSRMIEPKTIQPKKDLSEHVLIYSDRCILCGRCVRFCREISGKGELAIVNRGDRCEIDQFSGRTMHEMSGNVCDICPVGSLTDKEFLFRERVWYLTSHPSVCAGCATGCTIWADHRDERLARFRPRFNPKVNDFWMCDLGRYLWKNTYRPDRLMRYHAGKKFYRADQVADLVDHTLRNFKNQHGEGKLAAVLSPMLDNELIYMICKVVRQIDPNAFLIPGPQVVDAPDKKFKSGFTISSDRTPNIAGVKKILARFGGNQADLSQIAFDKLRGLWITGGYFATPLDQLIPLPVKPDMLIVQDSFVSRLSEMADVILPMAIWLEREGSFTNRQEMIQLFQRVVIPPMGMVQDGHWLARMVGLKGTYRAEILRSELAEFLGGFDIYEPPKLGRLFH